MSGPDQENSIHAGWMDSRMNVVVPMLAYCIIISLSTLQLPTIIQGVVLIMSLRNFFSTATTTSFSQSKAPIYPLLNTIIVASALLKHFYILLSPKHIIIINPYFPPPFSKLKITL